jgi:hypothetical protein
MSHRAATKAHCTGPDSSDKSSVGVADQHTLKAQGSDAVSVPPRRTSAKQTCLFCQGPIGIRRVLGAKFCCKSHELADRERMQLAMMDRLQRSAARIQAYLDGDSQRLEVRVSQTITQSQELAMVPLGRHKYRGSQLVERAATI